MGEHTGCAPQPWEQGPADCGAGQNLLCRVENGHIQSFTGSLRLLWPVISRAEELWPSSVTCKPKTFTLWPIKKILPTLL